MESSSADFQCVDEQAYYHGHHLVDLSQPLAQPFPHIPLTTDWGWSEGERPESSSARLTQNDFVSSWAMPTVSESTGGNGYLSTYDAYGTSMSIQHHSPDQSLGYVPTSSLTTLSPLGSLSPLSPPMERPRQESHKQHICDRDVHHPIVGTQKHAQPQTIHKNIRKIQQSRESLTVYPIRCQWDGCPYDGSFKKESSLIRHLRNIHWAPGAHPCPIQDCNKVCNRADNLTQHMRNIHN